APDPWQARNDRAHDPWQAQNDRAHDPWQGRIGVIPNAWQPQGADSPDPRQPQNTGARDAEQVRANNDRGLQEYHGELLQNTLNELDKEYQEKQDAAGGMQAVIDVLEYEMSELGAKLGELQDGLEYDRVFEQYKAKSEAVTQEYKTLKDLEGDMENLKRSYDSKVDEILSSNEAQ
ncbi:hypothetical protein BASA61_002299, partial [Batrachochytrium salamandrivorans]